MRSKKQDRMILALALVAMCGVLWGLLSSRSVDLGGAGSRKDFVTSDPVERGCSLDRAHLIRIWRGYHALRSEDIILVPSKPNFIGRFDLTSHSGPWRYLQSIPMILYGKGIEPSGLIPSPARIVDVYPTIGRLLDVDLPARDGVVLEEALRPDDTGRPKLVVTIVWDGAGRDTLDAWPNRIRTLRRLERDGTSYENAVVGSSPSITSSIHSSLGTGAFPRRHGVTGNEIRAATGELRDTFNGRSADDLKLTTFADEIDLAFDNASKVGLLGWREWHLGMMGHGDDLPEADRDELAIIKYRKGVRLAGNSALFTTPTELQAMSNINQYLDALDRQDGRADGKWGDQRLALTDREAIWTTYANPAWGAYEGDLAVAMLKRGSYGQDAVPDLFFINFKMSDLVGHLWGINSHQTAEVLAAQDRALERILEFLDKKVGDYVVILTADHGASPAPAESGAWPISKEELVADLNARYDVPKGKSLVETTVATGLFLNRELMREVGVKSDEVAAFINDYTIWQNWTSPELPAAFEDRKEEKVFEAAFPSNRLNEVMRCAAMK